MSHLNILFMGTPDFAQASLKALVEAGEQVVGVITGEDKRMGRGMKLACSEVKTYALSQKLPVYQPETLKNGAIAELLAQLQPDVIVVVAYGKLLPAYVLDFPKYGCINVHGSHLPAYRGAAPIQRAVLAGEAVTGVTTMHMDVGLDTGDMIYTEDTPIGENETVGEVWDRLAALGGALLLRTLNDLEAGTAPRIPQDNRYATYAPKIDREERKIDFSLPAEQIHNRIRGMSPMPAAYALLKGKAVKLFDSRVLSAEENGALSENTAASENGLFPGNKTLPGSVLSLSPEGVVVACGSGAVRISGFKPEGSRLLSAADMINGRHITVSDRFE